MTFRQPHTHQRIPQPMSPSRMLLMMEGGKPTAYAPPALSPYASAPSAAAALQSGSINYLPALLAPSPVPRELPPVPSPYLSKPAAVPPPAGPGGQKKRRGGKNRQGGMMRRTQPMTPGPDGGNVSNSPPSYLAQTASRRNAATPSTVLHTPPMTANSPTPYGSQMPREPLYARKFTPNNLTAIPASSTNKRLSPTAAELKHQLVTAHAVVVAEREPLPAPVFSTAPHRGGYHSGAKKSDPHNLHSPPLSPIHGTLLGDAGLAPPVRSAATVPAAGAVITTTTTTSTTTTTVSPPSPGTAAAPAAVLSNTTPDLLFLLTPTEHQALMLLLRSRIDGKPGGTLTIDKPSSANSSIAIAGLPPQSPTSGSLRRPSLIANPTIPAHVAAELNLLSAASSTPPSPSRSLHFAPATSTATNDTLGNPGGTLTILSTAGQPAQHITGGPGSPAKDGSPPVGAAVPPPGAGHRGRSKSFSSRASLPRRPSLQSVREEGGAITFGGALISQVNGGNSLVPPVLQEHVADVPVQNEEEERREYMLRAIAGTNAELAGHGAVAPSEFGATGTGPTSSPLRGAIVRRTSIVAPGVGDGSDRPRASSLVVRPIGGGGLIALPPNWSRQGSHASSTHEDDDESDTESVQMEPPLPPPVQLTHSATTITTTVSHGDAAQAARILSHAARAHNPPAPTPTMTFGPGVGNVLTIEPAPSASMERRHSAAGHHQLGLPTNRRQNAGRFTMGANFAAALKQHNVFGPAAQVAASGPGSLSVPFPVELLNDPGLPFDQNHEEQAGQYWSLSHALLLLERIALEKALTPQLESYLTQALDSISTAQAIVTQRMGHKMAIEEKLRTHPEPVADWLAEFAGGAAVPDEALSGTHGHSSRTSSISVSTARQGLNGSLASAPTSPKAHIAKKSSVAGLPGSPATAAASSMKPVPAAASSTSAAADSAAAAARANDPSSSLVVLESYLLRDPILALLSKSLEWDFELFEFHEASSQHSLVLLSVSLLRSMGLLDHFPSLDLAKFFAFFAAIEKGYKPQEQVPYHNAQHGADVMQGMVFFMQTPLLQSVLSPLDLLAGLVAAACHDYEHQGRNNAFMVATGNPLAILYNDASVMESHHASASWQVLMRPECDFLADLDLTVEARAEFRASFISAILHTDMTHHMSGVQEFEAAVKAKRSHGTWFSPTSKADRKMLLDMSCHVSDLGNPAKPFHLAREWTARVTEEFWRQGDAEAALGLKISPMCDRAKGAVDAQQLGFIDFVVGPLFNSWGDALEPQAIAPCLEHLKANKAFYKSRVPPPATPAVAATPPGPSGGSSKTASGASSPRAAGSLSLAGAAAPLALQFLAASSLRTSPWKNGGGSTRELVCWPPGSSLSAGDFIWRASSATVSAAGPFSVFPNRQRLLMILSGPGLKLQLAGESEPRLLTSVDAAPTLFDGSVAAHAELVQAGVSVEDVGLIFGPSVRVVSSVTQLTPAQSHTVPLRSQPRGQQILLVLLRGSVRVSALPAASASSSSSSAVASVSLAHPLDSAFLADVTVDGSLEIVSHASHASALLVFHISPA